MLWYNVCHQFCSNVVATLSQHWLWLGQIQPCVLAGIIYNIKKLLTFCTVSNGSLPKRTECLKTGKDLASTLHTFSCFKFPLFYIFRLEKGLSSNKIPYMVNVFMVDKHLALFLGYLCAIVNMKPSSAQISSCVVFFASILHTCACQLV